MEHAMSAFQRAETVRALDACNARTVRFGLTLSPEQMEQLAEGRFRALRETGRVEFGEGILPRLVMAFCDSPYLQQEDWAETLLLLQQVFYKFKNDFRDSIGDDTLLRLMQPVNTPTSAPAPLSYPICEPTVSIIGPKVWLILQSRT